MHNSRIAIAASVLTSSIRIDSCVERYVRALIEGDHSLGRIPQELGFDSRILYWVPIRVAFQHNRLKPVDRILDSATPANFRIPFAHAETLHSFGGTVHRLRWLAHRPDGSAFDYFTQVWLAAGITRRLNQPRAFLDGNSARFADRAGSILGYVPTWKKLQAKLDAAAAIS